MNLYTSAFVTYLVCAPFFSQEIEINSRVEADYDHDYDFGRLRTYAWSSAQQPAPNRADHIRIIQAVSESLETLGFRLDASKPDVRMSYTLETEQQKVHVDSRQHQSPWDPTDLETSVALGGHQEASLVIEMYESATGKRIWWAKCSHPQPTPDRVGPSLYQTVDHLFSVYPDRAEKQK